MLYVHQAYCVTSTWYTVTKVQGISISVRPPHKCVTSRAARFGDTVTLHTCLIWGFPIPSLSFASFPLAVSVELINMSRSRDPFVLLPRLPAAQKKLYKPPNETSLRAESETHVNEVIGEYREGNMLYYYARYDGGIAHRVRVFLWPL